MPKKKTTEPKDMGKICFELEQFSLMEGTEWGETASRLCAMWQGRCLLSEKFIEALEKEIKAWLKDVHENTHVEEYEETRNFKTKELVWDN